MSHHGFTADGGSDEWYTPEWIFKDVLGVSPGHLHDPFPREGAGGLEAKWPISAAPVWLNPPYSRIKDVVERCAVHPNWVFIAWCRTETLWCQRLLGVSEAQLWLNKRVRFIDGRRMVKDKKTGLMVENPGHLKECGTPGAPSFLAARGNGVTYLEGGQVMCHGRLTRTKVNHA